MALDLAGRGKTTSFSSIAIGNPRLPRTSRVCKVRASKYAYELTAKMIASPGCRILDKDESGATAGKHLSSIGWRTESSRQAMSQLLLMTLGRGQYIFGSILFEETLYQSTTDGKSFVDILKEQNIVLRIISKLRHPNVVWLRAYYFAKDEKLLICDYLLNGSLHSLIHGQ